MWDTDTVSTRDRVREVRSDRRTLRQAMRPTTVLDPIGDDYYDEWSD